MEENVNSEEFLEKLKNLKTIIEETDRASDESSIKVLDEQKRVESNRQKINAEYEKEKSKQEMEQTRLEQLKNNIPIDGNEEISEEDQEAIKIIAEVTDGIIDENQKTLKEKGEEREKALNAEEASLRAMEKINETQKEYCKTIEEELKKGIDEIRKKADENVKNTEEQKKAVYMNIKEKVNLIKKANKKIEQYKLMLENTEKIETEGKEEEDDIETTKKIYKAQSKFEQEKIDKLMKQSRELAEKYNEADKKLQEVKENRDNIYSETDVLSNFIQTREENRAQFKVIEENNNANRAGFNPYDTYFVYTNNSSTEQNETDETPKRQDRKKDNKEPVAHPFWKIKNVTCFAKAGYYLIEFMDGSKIGYNQFDDKMNNIEELESKLGQDIDEDSINTKKQDIYLMDAIREAIVVEKGEGRNADLKADLKKVSNEYLNDYMQGIESKNMLIKNMLVGFPKIIYDNKTKMPEILEIRQEVANNSANITEEVVKKPTLKQRIQMARILKAAKKIDGITVEESVGILGTIKNSVKGLASKINSLANRITDRLGDGDQDEQDQDEQDQNGQDQDGTPSWMIDPELQAKLQEQLKAILSSDEQQQTETPETEADKDKGQELGED